MPTLVTQPNLRQRAYRFIQDRIVSGQLAAGSLVSEQSLAREIGISRTPVREALRQLELEGLVEQVPRFGTIVRRADRREIVECYELREALESYAVAQAAQRITRGEMAQLEALCIQFAHIARQMEEAGADHLDDDAMRAFLAADMAFHMLLLRAGGNQRLMKIVADSRVLTRIFGYQRQEHDRHVVAEAHDYHRRVFEAVRAGEAEVARQTMAEHIRTSLRETLEHFDRQETSGRPERAFPSSLPDDVLQELERVERATRLAQTSSPTDKGGRS